jgi:serine/threonine protein kinase
MSVNLSFDPYQILEVNPRASQEVIKAAYHALIKTHHTDRGGQKAMAQKLNEAYQVLSDPATRAEYDSEKDQISGVVIGNYRVLEAIAEGGFGRTYKGEQLLNKELVCIKHCSKVSSAHDEILIQEAKAIWDLRHYALPVMRDLQRLDDGSLALIMSYIPGYTLEQIVEKAGKLEPETVAWMTERILNALLYLHHHGVIHGDIKPQNVIIQPKTHSVVLLDFGLAMVKPNSSSKSMGYTPVFASPEQIAGKTLLPASDYYSLGMLILYGLNGGKNLEKKLVPSNVPAAFCDFIRDMTKQDVLSRPQSDLFEKFSEVRQKSFGRTRSNFKGIPGFN